jgi:hypothetical protein
MDKNIFLHDINSFPSSHFYMLYGIRKYSRPSMRLILYHNKVQLGYRLDRPGIESR